MGKVRPFFGSTTLVDMVNGLQFTRGPSASFAPMKSRRRLVLGFCLALAGGGLADSEVVRVGALTFA